VARPVNMLLTACGMLKYSLSEASGTTALADVKATWNFMNKNGVSNSF